MNWDSLLKRLVNKEMLDLKRGECFPIRLDRNLYSLMSIISKSFDSSNEPICRPYNFELYFNSESIRVLKVARSRINKRHLRDVHRIDRGYSHLDLGRLARLEKRRIREALRGVDSGGYAGGSGSESKGSKRL